MKTIIAGGRDIKNPEFELGIALYCCPFFDKITEIVSGNCRGVDKAGEDFAINHGYRLTTFPANWQKYGKRAGYIRNTAMANYADALIVVWNGKSKGTKMMIDIARKKGLTIHEYEVTQ